MSDNHYHFIYHLTYCPTCEQRAEISRVILLYGLGYIFGMASLIIAVAVLL